MLITNNHNQTIMQV